MPRRPPRHRRATRWAWAAAAGLVAVAPLGTALLIRAQFPRQFVPGSPPPTVALGPPRRPLDLALADATAATLGLARDASDSASRLGRGMLDLEGGDEPAPGDSSPTDATAPTARDGGADAVWQAVGERVRAEIRPVAGSARHAFGFLLGPPPATEAL